jgi:hypothetical protein
MKKKKANKSAWNKPGNQSAFQWSGKKLKEVPRELKQVYKELCDTAEALVIENRVDTSKKWVKRTFFLFAVCCHSTLICTHRPA